MWVTERGNLGLGQQKSRRTIHKMGGHTYDSTKTFLWQVFGHKAGQGAGHAVGHGIGNVDAHRVEMGAR